MRKNYTFGLLFLVFGLLSGFSSFGQNPVANDDNLVYYYPVCGFDQNLNNDIIGNDFASNQIDYQSIDINLSEPGIQNSTIVNGNYISVNGWGGIYGSFQYAYNLQFQYTFKDNLGNMSNVATVTINSQRQSINYGKTNISCVGAANGSVTFNFPNNSSGQTATFIINLSREGFAYGTYTTVANATSFTVYELAQGNYNFNIVAYCGGGIASNQPNIDGDTSFYINVGNPLQGNATPTYIDYNNNGYVDVGDVVNFQYSITNTSSSCVVYNVEVSNPNLQGYYSPTGIISSINPGQTDNSITRTIAITQQHINNNSVVLNSIVGLDGLLISNGIYFAVIAPLSASNGIKLNAFVDSNNNGVQDGAEVNYTNGTFSYQVNSGTVHNLNTSSGELYLYESNPANIYNLTYNISSNNSYCGSQYNIATTSYPNMTVPNGSGISTYNFPITLVPCNDVSVFLISSTVPPVPGFGYQNSIQIKNDGNQVASGTITFMKDSSVSILYVNENILSTPSGFIHNFANLQAGQTRTINVIMQVPTIPTVTLGQFLSNSVTVTPNDAYIPNNSATLTQKIVGSYDPNDKTESHGGRILHSSFTDNDYLTYTIRFENTGTANALFVKVDDILDNKLEPSSIRMIASSHPSVLDRVGANLTWRFNGIDLPPSTPASTTIGHGYIVFQVKPKPGFVVGDVIPNTANIYFDFNPAIVTNTFQTEFVGTLDSENFTFNNFKSFPNPVRNTLTISNASLIETIEISSILGQKMIAEKVNDIQSEMDLSQLSKGIYFVKVTSQGNEKTVKIVKE